MKTRIMAVILMAASGFAADVPYGVCAHVTRSERKDPLLAKTLDAMSLANLGTVRSDFDFGSVRGKDGAYDFTQYDQLVARLETRGVKLLPIFYAPDGPRPPEDMAAYREYIRACVSHFGYEHFPVVEIWNEANLGFFMKGADPAVYADILKNAYEAVKEVDPRILVAYTGTAGVPLDWIRKSYEAGAARHFDIMCCHPYSHPARPEGSLDVQLEKLRDLMREFDAGEKPIWITEIGWPTHDLSIGHESVLLAGLKVARPGQKSWNVVFAANAVDEADLGADAGLARRIEDILPEGSTVRALTQGATCEALAKGGVDAVVFPFDETYPVDTREAVREFLRKGGVLVDFGGIPCYFRTRGSRRFGDASGVGDFPFGFRAWWTDANGGFNETAGVYPEAATATFATEVGLAAGVKQEPTGIKARRFLVPDGIGSESEWIPLVAGKTDKGVDLFSAVVVKYRGEFTGAAVLSSLETMNLGTNDEENQARYTARAVAIAMAEGIEGYFPYNLRSFGKNPYYSEDHFGLMQENFQPKPAYAAYAAFTTLRPVGSKNADGPWHNEARTEFYPTWTRPDGRVAGMFWRIGKAESRDIDLGGEAEFRNLYGRRIAVRDLGNGRYRIPVSESPVYFIRK